MLFRVFVNISSILRDLEYVYIFDLGKTREPVYKKEVSGWIRSQIGISNSLTCAARRAP